MQEQELLKKSTLFLSTYTPTTLGNKNIADMLIAQDVRCGKCLEQVEPLCEGVRHIIDDEATEQYSSIRTWLYECEKQRGTSRSRKCAVISAESYIPSTYLEKFADYKEFIPEENLYTTDVDKCLEAAVSAINNGVATKVLMLPALLKRRNFAKEVEECNFAECGFLCILQFDQGLLTTALYNNVASMIERRTLSGLPTLVHTSKRPAIRGEHEEDFYREVLAWKTLS